MDDSGEVRLPRRHVTELGSFFAAHDRWLFGHAFLRTHGDRELAADLVQDTFERVLRRPRFIRRDQDLAYLMRVLRNTWISSGRARRVTSVPLDEEALYPALSGGDPVVAQVIEGGAVYDALRGLSEPLREAVVAVDVVGAILGVIF